MKTNELTKEITLSSIDLAYATAEAYTEMGAEVTTPVSLDGGETFTFVVTY